MSTDGRYLRSLDAVVMAGLACPVSEPAEIGRGLRVVESADELDFIFVIDGNDECVWCGPNPYADMPLAA